MKRLVALLIMGLVVAVTGLVLAGVLHPGINVLAGKAEPRMIDGLPVGLPNDPAPSQPEALVVADATLFRAYGAYEFRPAHSDLAFAPSGPAMYAVSIPAGGQSFKCPLDLPHGAQIKRINVYVVDNSATNNMLVALYQVQLGTTSQSEIDSVSTSGLPTSATVRTLTMSGSPITTIDSARYAYALRYGPTIAGDTHMLVGARVEYSVPSGFLPFVRK